jgi:hypothetical protein
MSELELGILIGYAIAMIAVGWSVILRVYEEDIRRVLKKLRRWKP